MAHPDTIYLRRWTSHRDADAFAELVSRYSGLVYTACRRLLGNQADAEEVAQECFLKLARNEREISHLGGWLHTVAVRASLDRLRKEKRRRLREISYSDERARCATEEKDWDDILPLVDEAIAQLPEDVRITIVLRFLEGRIHAGIAKETGVSRTTVQKRIDKGLQQIRAFLDKRGVTAPASFAAILAVNMKAEAAPLSLISAVGKHTLSIMRPQPPISSSNLLVKGVISMLSKKTAVSLGVLAVCLLLALLALNQAMDTPTDMPSQEALTSSETDNSDPVDTMNESAKNVPTDGQSDARDVANAEKEASTIDQDPNAATPDSIDDEEKRTGPSATIAGLVQNEDAWPVADAHVWIEMGNDLLNTVGQVDTQTDYEGRFALMGITEFGNGTVYADAKGYLNEKRSLRSLKPGESRTGINIALTSASHFVKGIVVASDGQSVPQAQVNLIETQELPNSSGTSGWRTSMEPKSIFTTTSSNGQFELTIPKASTCTLLVLKEGFAEGRFPNVKTGTEDAQFVLSGFGAIAGRVFLADGTPAAEHVVTVVGECAYDPDNPLRIFLPVKRPKQMAVTDPEGNYTVEGLSPDAWYALGVFDQPESEIRINWLDYWLRPLSHKRDLHIEVDEVLSGVDFQLQENPLVRIAGNVRDRNSGQPIESLGIGCFVKEPYRFLTVATTGGDGAYELEFTLDAPTDINLHGTYLFLQGGSGGTQLKREGQNGANPTFSVSPGDDLSIDLVAKAPIMIPVRVVDGAGKPQAGFGVGVGFIQENGEWDYGNARCAPSDANGQCVLKGLPPNKPYFVWAQETVGASGRGKKPLPLAQYGPIQGTPGETIEPEVVLIAQNKGGIEGFIVDADGNPLANTPIVITAQSPADGIPQTVHSKTRDDGWLVIVYALTPGTYSELSFIATLDGQPLEGYAQNIQIASDTIADLGPITLDQTSQPSPNTEAEL